MTKKAIWTTTNGKEIELTFNDEGNEIIAIEENPYFEDVRDFLGEPGSSENWADYDLKWEE